MHAVISSFLRSIFVEFFFTSLRYRLGFLVVCPVGDGFAHFLKQVSRRCNLRTAFGRERWPTRTSLSSEIDNSHFCGRTSSAPASPLVRRTVFHGITRELRVHTQHPHVGALDMVAFEHTRVLKAAHCVSKLIHHKYIH